jgi:hypothetical protein
MSGLAAKEVDKLVFRYIGVNEGYLGDFSYNSHHEFYITLDLDIDPMKYEGTTRQRFTRILLDSAPSTQATILEGILDRYPVGSDPLRTQAIADEIRSWIERLGRAAPVPTPLTVINSETVSRALADAEQLLRSSGATSAVDRVHTALHGYLRAVCEDAGVVADVDATTSQLYRDLRTSHPAFESNGPRAGDIDRTLKSLAAVLDALTPLRNRASLAHPNAALLDEPEAMVVVNATRTLHRYVDDRIRKHRAGGL